MNEFNQEQIEVFRNLTGDKKLLEVQVVSTHVCLIRIMTACLAMNEVRQVNIDIFERAKSCISSYR